MRFLIVILFIFTSAGVEGQQAELVLPSGHSGPVRLGSFSPDNQYVITGGEDRTINVWETFTGVKLRTLFAGFSSLRSIGFSPDGKNIFALTDSSLSVWAFPSYNLRVQVRGAMDFVFSPNGSHIYVLDFEGRLTKMDINGKTEWSQLLQGRGLGTMSSDGKLIPLLGSSSLKLVDANGHTVKSVDVENPQFARFLPGNKTLSIVTDKTIFQYDHTSNALEALGDGGEKLYFSGNGRFVGVTGFEGGLNLFDLDKLERFFSFANIYTQYDSIAVMDTNGDFRYEVGKMKTRRPGMRAAYNGIRISDDGAYITSDENVWTIGDIYNSYSFYEPHPLLHRFTGGFSRDNRYLLALDSTTGVGLWDLQKKLFVRQYKGQSEKIISASIDRKGEKIASVEWDLCKIISPISGKTLFVLDKHKEQIGSAIFSPDGTMILTNSFDSTACLWDATTGALIQQFPGHHYELNPVYFDPKGELVRPEMKFDRFTTQDVETGELIEVVFPQRQYNPANLSMAYGKTYRYIPLPANTILTNSSLELSWDVEVNAISPDEKIFAMARQWTDSIMIGNPATGVWERTISAGTPHSGQFGNNIIQLLFSPGGKYLLVTDINRSVTILDVTKDYRIVKQVPGEYCGVAEDGQLLLVVNEGRLDLYDVRDLTPLYSYISMGQQDYLVVDNQRRYDGSPGARKYIYFTCENEVIGLDQFRDRLWVPGLAGRIIAKDSIYTPGIGSLNICGFTPRVEPKKESRTGWEYEITPRNGGLGETLVFVNGVEVKRYKKTELKAIGSRYLLSLDSAELRSYYFSGSVNLVTVRAYTTDNTISSRGLERKDSLRQKTSVPPNVYAIMIGVSDYKGEQLDLKYAAKDASDLAATLKTAAGKLLNTDGKEHVFVYNLTTNEGRYRMPEKLAIMKTIAEIGEKATPNDILLIFFAGHGVMHGESKQFYFLTSEASGSQTEADIPSVGISTAELTEWIRPARMKAQKRILIFDACNSGQAIRDFVKLGKDEQGYVAARRDDPAQQAKLIEKMNDRAGFTILSAAATNQSAYEFGQYAQGLLTFALLKTVKEQPDILINGKYLDISRWFQASKNTVEALVAASSARQEPQVISNTNFVIGLVDEEVLSGIHLPVERPVFSGAIINNLELGFDNLGFTRMMNSELRNMNNEVSGLIIYRPDDAGSAETHTLAGTYVVKDGQVEIRINLVRNNRVIDSLQLNEKESNAEAIIQQVRKWLMDKYKFN